MTPWTVACQGPLSMRFSKQEYWSRLPFTSPGGLPDPGIKPMSPTGRFFTTEPPVGGWTPTKRSWSEAASRSVMCSCGHAPSPLPDEEHGSLTTLGGALIALKYNTNESIYRIDRLIYRRGKVGRRLSQDFTPRKQGKWLSIRAIGAEPGVFGHP